MYQAESARVLLRWRTWGRSSSLKVSRNVVLLGLVSMLTDTSSEMVAAVLPLYVFFSLGASPLQVGVIEGLYQGASAFARIGSGLASDRWRRHREVAAVGYGLSALTKAGFLLVGSSVGAVAGLVLVDRTGKGIRTAPRDALISLSSPREGLGAAFGVHRAMDAAGALLGPLLAFGLLVLAPLQFHAIFVVSLCFALLGVGVLVLFVENKADTAPLTSKPEFSLRAAREMLSASRYRTLCFAGAVLSVMTVSDGFLYLALQRRLDFQVIYVPLLFVGTALSYMLLAVPMGRLADRVGRAPVFIGGYLLLLLTYTALVVPELGPHAVPVYLLLLGGYYAATDGVFAALASAVLPVEVRTTGLAVLSTITALGGLVSALAFGALWTLGGVQVAALAFTGGLAVATLVVAVMLWRRGEP